MQHRGDEGREELAGGPTHERALRNSMMELDESLDGPRGEDVRSRARALFSFLKEFTELRTRTTRSVDDYERVLWLVDVPREPGCDCAAWHRGRGEEEAEVWLEIRQPRLHPPPEVEPDLELACTRLNRALPRAVRQRRIIERNEHQTPSLSQRVLLSPVCGAIVVRERADREFHELPPCEVALLMATLRKSGQSLNGETLYREVLRVYGFSNLTANIRAPLALIEARLGWLLAEAGVAEPLERQGP